MTKANNLRKLSEDEELLSYAKYYYKKLADIGDEKRKIIKEGPCDPSKALSIYDRNKIFEKGYLDVEVGYCQMDDGTGFVANKTFFPNCTGKMFAWWFAWHSLEDLRYKIWDPEDHIYARNMNRDRILDPNISILEKNWETSHDILEDIGFGDEKLTIHFKNPKYMGLDVEKIFIEYCSAIQTGNAEGDGLNATMLHMVRDVDGGVELRSRFWIGYHIHEGEIKRLIPEGEKIPLIASESLFKHNCVEFANLSNILPRVYAEEKDNW